MQFYYIAVQLISERLAAAVFFIAVGLTRGAGLELATVLRAAGRPAVRAAMAAAERATIILREAFMAEYISSAVSFCPR